MLEYKTASVSKIWPISAWICMKRGARPCIACHAAIEKAGVEFLPGDGGGPGVRLRKGATARNPG